jgi:hypothetical protein
VGRFLDALNTPSAAIGVLLVVVLVNVFLYLGYRSSGTPTPPPAEHGGGPQTTSSMETTRRAGPEDRTRPEGTRPETTPQSTNPAERTATPSAIPSATASATASPSP